MKQKCKDGQGGFIERWPHLQSCETCFPSSLGAPRVKPGVLRIDERLYSSPKKLTV